MAQQPFKTTTGYYKTAGDQYTVYSLYAGYSITFETNGGVAVSPINDVVSIPTLPVSTRSGYFFNGWYKDVALTIPAVAGDHLTGDITLYAAWIQVGLNTPDASNVGFDLAVNHTYALSKGQITTLIADISTSTFLDNIVLLTETPVESLVNLRMYPFDISAHSATGVLANQTIYLGVYATDVTDADAIFGGYDCTFDLGSFTLDRYFNNFMDFAPYTKVEIWLPFLGFYTLDTSLVMGRTVEIKYVVDFTSGKCTAFLIADGAIVFTQDGVIGVDVPLGLRNGAEIGRSMLKTGITAVAGAVTLAGGAITAGAGEVSAGASVMAATGTASWAASASVGAVGAMQSHVVQKGTTGTAANAWYGPTHCYVIVTRPKPNVPTNYDHLIGRPSAKRARLGDLSGYTVVDKLHVENLTTATVEEQTEVERLLKSGVLL